jgi:hypothetical protein
MKKLPDSTQRAGRDAGGRFRRGTSGNPGGSSRVRSAALADVTALARSYTRETVERLAAIMRAGPPAAAVAASREILDRGYGKPRQEIVTQAPAPVIEVKNFGPPLDLGPASEADAGDPTAQETPGNARRQAHT